MADGVDTQVDLLIVGSGPAGLSAARAYRDHGGEGRVLLLSADPDAPYERPPLSKDFLRGDMTADELALLEVGELRDRELEWFGSSARSLDPHARQVVDDTGRTIGYHWCVLATGSTPARLPIPGGDSPHLLPLRTLADSHRLRALATGGARTAAVIGSGFIGCEAAASLATLGLDVTLVTAETAPQQKRLGDAAAARIAGWLRADGIDLHLAATLTSIDAGPEHSMIELDGAAPIEADLVLTAVGVHPNGELGTAAGLAMKDGRILTDAAMRSTTSGVLAAGDVAMAFNTTAGRPLSVEHWGEALAMGEIAGTTAAGAEASWNSAPGFWSDIGDRTLKYAAWGDGYDQARLVEHPNGGFTVWYTDRSGATVGVLTHDADDDYENGSSLVEKASPPPAG